jgi:hypothetical protein
MRFSWLRWRIVVPIVMVLGLVNFGAVKFVRDAYPSDPFKSEALAKCIAGDRGFIRFLPDDRDKCYARQPHASRVESPANETQSAASD